jgi:hypothetical protein
MTTKRIKDLALKTPVESADEVAIYDAVSTLDKKTTTSDIRDFVQGNLSLLQFIGGGSIDWNSTYYTINVDSTLGPVLQVGQELYKVIYNDTGLEIGCGKAVRLTGVAGGYPSVSLAKADAEETLAGSVLITTMTIPDGQVGIATNYGRVQGVATTGFGPLYVSPDTAGELTQTKPEFPCYTYAVGAVEVVDGVNGVYDIDVKASVFDTFNEAWDGAIRQTFDFRTSSDGATITGTLTNPNVASTDLELLFSDGIYSFDTTTLGDITLTGGTATVPQMNYVYIPKDTKVLTVSTSEFPADEHCRVAELYLQDATTIQSVGALRNQNINDHIKLDDDNGHILHIAQRLRALNAEWDTGAESTLTVTGGVSDVWVSNTSGKVYQMHLQTFPAQDMSTGDDIHVVNDPTTPYRTTDNLNDISVDSDGVTLNNRWFSGVVWGVANKSGETSHLMFNLPSGSYTSEEGAVSDSLGYANYTIPKEFKGVGFLIGRYTMRKSGTTFTYNPLVGYQDLRGFIPNSTAGSGAGSSGITTFTGLTDTPSTYVGQAGKVATVNSGETALEFTDTASGITNGYLYGGTSIYVASEEIQPLMTNNTTGARTPAGTCSADFNNVDAWKALDGVKSGTTAYYANAGNLTYEWNYDFETTVRLKGIRFYNNWSPSGSRTDTANVFRNGDTGSVIKNFTAVNSDWGESILIFDNVEEITQLGIECLTRNGTGAGIGEIEFIFADELDITELDARNDDDTADVILPAEDITSQIPSGISTTYYIFGGTKSAVDGFYVETSLSPASYTSKVLCGRFETDGSGDIIEDSFVNYSMDAQSTIDRNMPDHNNAISLSVETYVAPSNGFVSAKTSGTTSILVENTTQNIGNGSTHNIGAIQVGSVPCAKGDTITISKAGGSYTYRYFTPLKGNQ